MVIKYSEIINYVQLQYVSNCVKAPGQDFSRQAVRRLALNGQRGIRSVFSICKQVANTPLLFYSTFGAEWPCTLNTLFAPQATDISEEFHPACT